MSTNDYTTHAGAIAAAQAAIRILDPVNRGMAKILDIKLPLLAPQELRNAVKDLKSLNSEIGRALDVLRGIK